MKAPLLVLVILNLHIVTGAFSESACKYPGNPRHGELSLWVDGFPSASTAEYVCSPGYNLLGPKTVTCLEGKWDRAHPMCVRDIARGKPVNQSEPTTTDYTSGMVVDGDDLSCTEPANLWTVSLFERTRITTVKLVFGDDVAAGAASVWVGDGPSIGLENSTRELCAKLDVAMKKNTTYFVRCDSQLSPGSFIAVRVEKSGPVPLCALEAHTSSGLSQEDACPEGYKDTIKDAFDGTCFEFHFIDPAPIGDARSICYKANGRLIGEVHMGHRTLSYLNWRSENLFRGSPFWLDINSTEAAKLLNNTEWTNEVGSGDCYVLSSKKGFTRSECQSPNHVICAYDVVTCGRPGLPRAFHGWQVVEKLKTGRKLRNVRCSEGFYPEIEEPLACDQKGEFLGNVRCRNFTCGTQPAVNDANSWAISNSSVEYSCVGAKFIKGDHLLVCNSSTLRWGKPPTCRTLIQVMTDFFQATWNFVEGAAGHENNEPPKLERFVFMILVAAAVIIAIFVVIYRVYTSRIRRKFEEAFRLGTRTDSSVVARPQPNTRLSVRL